MFAACSSFSKVVEQPVAFRHLSKLKIKSHNNHSAWFQSWCLRTFFRGEQQLGRRLSCHSLSVSTSGLLMDSLDWKFGLEVAVFHPVSNYLLRYFANVLVVLLRWRKSLPTLWRFLRNVCYQEAVQGEPGGYGSVFCWHKSPEHGEEIRVCVKRGTECSSTGLVQRSLSKTGCSKK